MRSYREAKQSHTYADRVKRRDELVEADGKDWNSLSQEERTSYADQARTLLIGDALKADLLSPRNPLMALLEKHCKPVYRGVLILRMRIYFFRLTWYSRAIRFFLGEAKEDS